MDSSSVLRDPSGRTPAKAHIHVGDCLETLKSLPDQSVHTCITSPPYFGLRSYLPDDHPHKEREIGLEQTTEQFVAALVAVFRAVRRVLRDDGTLWLNLGDSYANTNKGHNSNGFGGLAGSNLKNRALFNPNTKTPLPHGLKAKDLIGIPWRVAFALQADGWYLRQDVIWSKPNPMPESVRDRCTKAHEYLFLLSKSERYYFDHEAIREPSVGTDRGPFYEERGQHAAGKSRRHSFARETKASAGEHGQKPQHRPDRPDVDYGTETRNKRSVWTVSTKPYSGAHFATYPPDLIEPCVLACCPEGGTVLDPFGGSGTTAGVALRHGRNAVVCELNAESVDLIPARVLSIVCPGAKPVESGPDAPQTELFGGEVTA